MHTLGKTGIWFRSDSPSKFGSRTSIILERTSKARQKHIWQRSGLPLLGDPSKSFIYWGLPLFLIYKWFNHLLRLYGTGNTKTSTIDGEELYKALGQYFNDTFMCLLVATCWLLTRWQAMSTRDPYAPLFVVYWFWETLDGCNIPLLRISPVTLIGPGPSLGVRPWRNWAWICSSA